MKSFRLAVLHKALSALLLAALVTVGGCHHDTAQTIGPDCLTDVKLVDSGGQPFVLSSLRGKPVVVDFIYTSCPGPCMMETAKLANVALRLGTDLGSKAAIVSITVDPEHDGPKQLHDYAEKQGADTKGWYFLTGSPGDVDTALAGFRIARQREPDGTVAHMVNMFLIGRDGREAKEYNAEEIRPQTVVQDVETLIGGGEASRSVNSEQSY
jgi:protein SCO1/2